MKKRTILVNSKRKRNKGSEKFEKQAYKNKGGIASLKKEEIVKILKEKYKHPNPKKLMKKTKNILIERLKQVQENLTENATIIIPELDVVEVF